MDWIIIVMAGFLGGMLNAVAGGGSFITLPALIFVGVPPVSANATGTAALLPGYIASAWRFKNDVELPAGLGFASIALIAVAGGGLGAAALLMTDERIFVSLIPWLILLATFAFAAGPRLVLSKTAIADNADSGNEPIRHKTLTIASVLFGICIYGGYFNGGLGIIILAALGLTGQTSLHGMNGLKNVLSALLTVVAVAVYAAGNTISLKYLCVLGIAAIIGGYTGASIAYRISQKHLRTFVIVVGFLMSAAFFFKNT